MNDSVRLAIGVIVLAGIAVAVLSWAGIDHRRAVLVASVRAVVQLSFVALVLRGVFAAPVAVIGVLAVMFSVAVWTAGQRLRSLASGRRAVLLACAAGSTVAVGLIVGMPILTREIRTLVAVAGIVFGGTMTAATLAGRRLADGLVRQRDEIEAWLALGATSRQSVASIARNSAYEALVPALDQTRTVGWSRYPAPSSGRCSAEPAPAPRPGSRSWF